MSMVEDVRARRTGSGDEVFIMAVSAKVIKEPIRLTIHERWAHFQKIDLDQRSRSLEK